MKSKISGIHLIGIGGTGMGSLARLLVESGYKITGSDVKLYPPMSDQLKELNIKVYEGYSSSNLSDMPELVIVGNVITKENPEAQAVLEQGLKYYSMPQALKEFFLKGKTPIVVSGTHGKTTTSTLLAWLLESAGENPGFFIGGVGRNFNKSAHLGKGVPFVVEGDEYDTAFFDKGPKFLHYSPQVLLITSIEFDHADIYKDIDHIKESFRKLISIVPPDGLIIANGDDDNVLEVIGEAKTRVLTYGLRENCNYTPTEIATSNKETVFALKTPTGVEMFKIPLFGYHNLLNSVSAVAALLEYGIKVDDIRRGLTSFKGVKRRQELFAEVNTISIIDDFAHHPTAVSKTIESMRHRFPGRRLWAVFEPRSNTSRRNIFKEEYIKALSKADRVILASVHAPEKVSNGNILDVAGIADSLMRKGVDAHYIPGTNYIIEYLLRNVGIEDVILVMSNGNFDNILPKLSHGLGKRRVVKNGK